jgi:hypothetical protein
MMMIMIIIIIIIIPFTQIEIISKKLKIKVYEFISNIFNIIINIKPFNMAIKLVIYD